MENPLEKLFQSSTLMLGLMGLASHALWPAMVPAELIMTLIGAYGVKEAGKQVATRGK